MKKFNDAPVKLVFQVTYDPGGTHLVSENVFFEWCYLEFESLGV